MLEMDNTFEVLLDRDVVSPDARMMAVCIRNKSVMVTGAGGSIGTEICRQLARHQPLNIILFERSEFALYSIENVLREQLVAQKRGNRIKIVPILGCVTDKHLVETTLAHYRVDTLYHAAAYKQVPMLEQNVIAGVRNNIFGTLTLAKAAEKHGVKNFVFVSTDKAINPINVMGATKRMAELVLQARNAGSGKTCFSMVRFGNVLGSSGSVLPLFRKQILDGGPVTVTHPDVSRYFMTAGEAAQLVIQAGALARGGEIFVLDMHEPVRIADMAKKLIALMGYEVCESCSQDACLCERGIRIQYTGLRDGEKLTEEVMLEAAVSRTPHEKIFRSMEPFHPWPVLTDYLDRLEQACSERDPELARTTLVHATQLPLADADQQNPGLLLRGQDQDSELTVKVAAANP